ncbi:MAG TPA: histidine kinase dimerization/phospho-acceptor domain-containing protein [Phycisphaerae bacterium]|nr:histidine kinase dimerization/phospho-acceptor domain-containing protein [Phycisphaerae bacterium]
MRRKPAKRAERAPDEAREGEAPPGRTQELEAPAGLAAGIAHDICNQLTVVTGYCDVLLAAEKTDAAARALLEEIRRAAQRAAELAKQIMEYGGEHAS